MPYCDREANLLTDFEYPLRTADSGFYMDGLMFPVTAAVSRYWLSCGHRPVGAKRLGLPSRYFSDGRKLFHKTSLSSVWRSCVVVPPSVAHSHFHVNKFEWPLNHQRRCGPTSLLKLTDDRQSFLSLPENKLFRAFLIGHNI